MTFAKPEVGSEIEITTNTPNPTLPNALPNYYRGKVVTPFKWINEYDFCLSTNDRSFPVRVVDIRHVTQMKFVDGSAAVQTEYTPVPKIESWTVEGSKDNVYIVTRDNGKWSCDCVAGKFNRHCKHVAAIQDKFK
jgi:hypothetical protein